MSAELQGLGFQVYDDSLVAKHPKVKIVVGKILEKWPELKPLARNTEEFFELAVPGSMIDLVSMAQFWRTLPKDLPSCVFGGIGTNNLLISIPKV